MTTTTKKKAAAKKPKAAPAPKRAPDPMKSDLSFNELVLQNPKLALFVAELTLTSGNASEAASACGWSASYGRNLVQRFPQLREAAATALESMAQRQVIEWRDMHQRARRKIDRLLTSPDDRVALRAAEVVVERVEGKVKTVFVHEAGDRMSDENVLFRFVSALFLAQGTPIHEGWEFALKHPDVVESWGRKVGLIKEKQPEELPGPEEL